MPRTTFSDDHEPSDQDVADATNEALLEAVMTDDEHGVSRAIERGWPEWLNSSWARNNDPATNPVLMAISTPGKQGCLDAFQRWSNDIHRWQFDRWTPLHWAIAGRNEDGVAWALRNGLEILTIEDGPDGQTGGPRRSGLALAAQMGDPAWLQRVLDLSVQTRAEALRDPWSFTKPLTMQELARREHWQTLPALTVVLHEMAEQDRRQALGQEDDAPSGDWDGCQKVLTGHGFRPDSTKIIAAKFSCAIALADPAAPGLDAYQRATLLAAALGSGRGTDGPDSDDGTSPEALPPVRLFEAAGERLDTDWRRSLLLIGLQEGPEHGCWAMGAGRTLRQTLNENALTDPKWSVAQRRELTQALRESFASAGVPAWDRPMRGHEDAFVEWLGTSRAHPAVWRERMTLADVAAEVEQDGQAPDARPRSRL